jgi:16S rRNA (cytosine1402-N4)-methyltransferase
MYMINNHIPVLLESIKIYLPVSGIAFDGTFGGGGYTNAFLDHGLEVYASDLDETTIQRRSDLADNPKLHFIHDNFATAITSFSDNSLNFITLDLGFSSNQLEDGDRGFSYLKPDEIFDLRYDISSGVPCWQKLSRLSTSDELSRILFNYSGESLSRRIAESLFKSLHRMEIQITVGEVSEQIIAVIPQKFMRSKNAILSRIWQALRIWTNDEFKSIENFLPVALQKLTPGGVLAIVCFHSLEDKLVTKFMRTVSTPEIIDDFGNKKQDYTMLSSKAIIPTEQEIDNNPRSRSATLRVLKRAILPDDSMQ